MEIVDEFKKIFPMDYSYLSNYTQYLINNREWYANWCKSFSTPCIYRKVRKEDVKLDPSGTTEFSNVDKYIIAYGNQVTMFSDNGRSYISYEAYLPIQNESFSKLNVQFSDPLTINAPYDSRFEYKVGDQIVFKYNDFVFRYEISSEPTSYAGILYQLELQYIDKMKIQDLIQVESEPKRSDEEKYW